MKKMARYFALLGSFVHLSVQAQTPDLTVSSLDGSWEKRAALHSSLHSMFKSKPRLPDDHSVLWRVARLCHYLGFFALPADNRRDDRVEIFRYGVESADRARKLEPERVEGHYWFAVNQGGLGITRGVMASLGSAETVREALDEAVRLDPHYHFSGPFRVRGRLYAKLPGGIFSFGDARKAYADLKKATEQSPESKLNFVYFAEVAKKFDSEASVMKLLENAKKLPPVAGDEEEAAYARELAELEKRWR